MLIWILLVLLKKLVVLLIGIDDNNKDDSIYSLFKSSIRPEILSSINLESFYSVSSFKAAKELSLQKTSFESLLIFCWFELSENDDKW